MKAFALVTVVALSSSSKAASLTPRLSNITRQRPIRRNMPSSAAKNVLGTTLEPCSLDPMTGFFRDGCCNTGPNDIGMHTVCAEVDERFLSFTRSRGNDLSSAIPGAFPGLKPGDRWCLCVRRWIEAYQAGAAPPVVLKATHEDALQYVDLSVLQEFAIDTTRTEL